VTKWDLLCCRNEVTQDRDRKFCTQFYWASTVLDHSLFKSPLKKASLKFYLIRKAALRTNFADTNEFNMAPTEGRQLMELARSFCYNPIALLTFESFHLRICSLRCWLVYFYMLDSLLRKCINFSSHVRNVHTPYTGLCIKQVHIRQWTHSTSGQVTILCYKRVVLCISCDIHKTKLLQLSCLYTTAKVRLPPPPSLVKTASLRKKWKRNKRSSKKTIREENVMLLLSQIQVQANLNPS
jgi:hypothetical protein